MEEIHQYLEAQGPAYVIAPWETEAQFKERILRSLHQQEGTCLDEDCLICGRTPRYAHEGLPTTGGPLPTVLVDEGAP
jgi:hypothetical protein